MPNTITIGWCYWTEQFRPLTPYWTEPLKKLNADKSKAYLVKLYGWCYGMEQFRPLTPYWTELFCPLTPYWTEPLKSPIDTSKWDY